MFIKSIIFILFAYLLQLSSLNWYNILFFSAIIGVGSRSYKQSCYLGFLIGAIPWSAQFAFYINDGATLLNRISNMFGLNHPLILISLSILFISFLSISVSMSSYHIKRVIKNEK